MIYDWRSEPAVDKYNTHADMTESEGKLILVIKEEDILWKLII